MRITVGKNEYDVRFRQGFVTSKSGKHQVRETVATLSLVDNKKKGANRFKTLDTVTLTQNVKDQDDKKKAQRMAIGKLLQSNFRKPTRARLWREFLPSLS